MNNGRKISSKYFSALIFTVLFFSVTHYSEANYSNSPCFCKFLTAVAADTSKPLAPAVKDSISGINPVKDTSIKDSIFKDTAIEKTDTFNIKVSKDSLDAPITYSASDSIVMEVPSKKITLFNKATAKQKDLDLSAYKIEYDQDKQVVVATYTTDTSGKMIGRPKMVQADNTIESDTMVYNLKNQKGITKNSYTTSGEMFFYQEKLKKIAPEEFYASRGRFTTCNLDTPHFAFRTNKMKVINKKFAITGPVHPEFEGVPLPIYIPFGFFPLVQGRHSGLLPPQFTASDQFGLGLEGLGYYKVINDNFDVTFRTNLYSYGGWAVFVDPEYLVRYRYRGHLDFSLQKTRILNPTGIGTNEFQDTKTYRLTWSHTVDGKARPGTNFSANVNLQSLKYNQFVFNNPTANYTNSISSSIAYSKTWKDGKYNLTLSGNHSQNSNDGSMTITLPNLGFTVTTLYPFQKKEVVGAQKWYEKLGVGLNTSFNNQARIYDSLFNLKKLIDTFQWGAHHSLPISLALPQMGPFQIAPGVSFQQNWYQAKTILTNWDGTSKIHKIDTTAQKGFYTESDMSFSLSVSTAVFGTFNKFGKNSNILGIRHVIRPTFSLSYKPDLTSKDYYWVTYDSLGHQRRVSYFQGNTYSSFAEGRFGGMSFGFDNTLEMKVRSKKDTSESAIKKIKLIDGFGFNGSYNYLADSNRLSPISLYLRSTLFQKINITASATLDPYVKDSLGNNRKNFYAWQQKGKFSLGTIDQGNIAISTSFKAKPKDQKAEEEKKKQQENQIPLTMEEQQAQMNYIATHAAEFADFNIDWSLNLSFSLNFTRTLKTDLTGYQTLINSGLNWSGDFNLTPKWKFSMSSFYDVKNQKINSLSMSISRDMHCWQMAINVIPIGYTRSFNITISPKAGILRDLKVNRSRYFYAE
ncbi:MAG TPA: putative LPS assembly protein LptD [Puia sp.]|nr:putative LPS assembly protein LptD [Puia sp.]